MQEAAYYKQLEQGEVQCQLCPHFCHLSEGQNGFCRARQNQSGRLSSQNYAQITSLALDPIEKKPLYHFYPGRQILSVGSWGCNLHCAFCQNWQISQMQAPAEALTPAELVEMAEVQKEQKGNLGLAYTYSEPLVWWEYLRETATLAKSKGLKNVLVSNGFINPQPWSQILPLLDACNLDLKAFRGEFYQELCQGELEPVKQTIRATVEAKVHLEITTLVVEDWNEMDIEALAQWLAELNPLIPLHLSRYFPNYHFGSPPTSEKTLRQAQEVAHKYLKYVYLGNVDLDQNTLCPQCGKTLVKRKGYQVKISGLKNLQCSHCRRPVDLKNF